jgi:hypothetical protein
MILVVISYPFFGLLEYISYIYWNNTVNEYQYINGSITYPLWSAIFYLIMILCKEAYNKEKIIRLDEICNKYVILFGLMDMLYSTIHTIIFPFLSIQVDIITSKLIIILIMPINYYLLNKKYLINHYIGSFIILTGIGLIIYENISTNIGTVNIIPIVLKIFIVIIAAFLNPYKEKYLKDGIKQNSVVNFAVCLWQLIFGIIFIVGYIIYQKYIGLDPIKYIEDAISCQYIYCNLSFVFLIIYNIIGTITGIFQYYILQKYSSVVLTIMNIVKTPLLNISCYLLIKYNIMKTTEDQKYTITYIDIVIMFLIIFGSIIYNYKKEEYRTEYKKIDEEEMEIIKN